MMVMQMQPPKEDLLYFAFLLSTVKKGRLKKKVENFFYPRSIRTSTLSQNSSQLVI